MLQKNCIQKHENKIEMSKERYITPENRKKKKIIDELRLV